MNVPNLQLVINAEEGDRFLTAWLLIPGRPALEIGRLAACVAGDAECFRAWKAAVTAGVHRLIASHANAHGLTIGPPVLAEGGADDVPQGEK